MLFLKVWLFAGSALGMAVVVLWVIYRLLDSDIGFEGIIKEAIITATNFACGIALWIGYVSVVE